MGPATEESHTSRKLITSTGIFSFCFVIILLLMLHSFGLLYGVGKLNSYYLIIVLIIGETGKFIFKKTWQNNQKLYTSKHGNFLKSSLLILTSVAIFYTIPVLYGASILSEFEETLLLSLTLTTLTTLQSLIHLGYKNTVTVLCELTTLDLSLSEPKVILKNIQGCLIGGLCGAIVIPLDWNRAWQAWPVPCFVGAIGGYAVANVFSAILACWPNKKNVSRKRCV